MMRKDYRREAGSEESAKQRCEPMNKNRIRGVSAGRAGNVSRSPYPSNGQSGSVPPRTGNRSPVPNSAAQRRQLRVARTIAERDRRSKTKPRHLARRGKAFYSENFAEVDHRNSEFVVLRNSEGNASRSGCAFEEISACGQFLLLLSRLEIPGIVRPTIRSMH